MRFTLFSPCCPKPEPWCTWACRSMRCAFCFPSGGRKLRQKQQADAQIAPNVRGAGLHRHHTQLARFGKQDLVAVGVHALQHHRAVGVQEQAQGRAFGAVDVADAGADKAPALFCADFGVANGLQAAFAGTGRDVYRQPFSAQPVGGFFAGGKGGRALQALQHFGIKPRIRLHALCSLEKWVRVCQRRTKSGKREAALRPYTQSSAPCFMCVIRMARSLLPING